MSHFGAIGHHLIVAIIDIYRPYTSIYRSWLGDVQWGHLMTHVVSTLKNSDAKTEWLAARFAPGSSAPHAPEVSRYLDQSRICRMDRHGRIIDYN